MSHRIVVAGAGVIGRAAGLLLIEWGTEGTEIWIGDARPEAAREAAEWIRAGATAPEAEGSVHAFTMPADGSDDDLDEALAQGEVLLDCLPWPQAVRMATLARRHDLHYVNLTEHVTSAEAIGELAEGSERGFVLQTGLAPGFVDVLGHKLFLDFCQRHGVDRVESLRLRVGALPTRVLPPHYYGYTWNPRGVATQYLEPSVVVRDGEKTARDSRSGVATVWLGEMVFEEALTSGGAADLPDHLAGRVRDLDYKTLRHPGHWEWVERMVADLPDGDPKARIEALQELMESAIPQVEVDQVVIYAAVEGHDRAGVRRRLDELLVVPPRTVGKHTLKAIQHTTAAGMAESAHMLLADGLTGVIPQSRIEPERWLAGPLVRRSYYGD